MGPLKQFQRKSDAGAYGDFVAQVDDAAGPVLRAIDEIGGAGNTLAVFTSDNGARWPGGIATGGQTPGIGCLTDLMATVAAVTGTTLPRNAGEDSFNLLPLMTGKTDRSPREAVVHHSALGMFSIRDREWKLNLGHGSGEFSEPIKVDSQPGGPAGELFDMSADPGETNDMYAKRPDVVQRPGELLRRYQDDGRSRRS